MSSPALIDYLRDIVSHTYSLGNIDLVKVDVVDGLTTISAIPEDKSTVIMATTKQPVEQFISTLGMPNLSKLNTILNIPEYKADAEVTVSLNGAGVPAGVTFVNKAGDFRNDYRFMTAALVSEQIKPLKFNGATWHVSFAPTEQSIQRLKSMAAANAEETTFTAKTEDGDLKFFFGDHSTHAGNFVFKHAVKGELHKAWRWPVATVMSILNLSGDKTIQFSNDGAAEITVDSGLTVYRYIIPGQQK